MSFYPKRPTFLKTFGDMIKKGGSESGSNSSGSFIFNLESPNSPKAMLNVLNNDDEVKEKFSEYIDKTLNTENEIFLEHVQHYKNNYPTKSERWKKNVCLRIVKLFVCENSPMQINISSILRDKIIKESEKNPPDSNLFDVAFDEIVNILTNGPWGKFIDIERKAGNK